MLRFVDIHKLNGRLVLLIKRDKDLRLILKILKIAPFLVKWLYSIYVVILTLTYVIHAVVYGRTRGDSI